MVYSFFDKKSAANKETGINSKSEKPIINKRITQFVY